MHQVIKVVDSNKDGHIEHDGKEVNVSAKAMEILLITHIRILHIHTASRD